MPAFVAGISLALALVDLQATVGHVGRRPMLLYRSTVGRAKAQGPKDGGAHLRIDPAFQPLNSYRNNGVTFFMK